MNFGKSSAFFWCSLLLSSLPSYSFPEKHTPLLAWWLQRGFLRSRMGQYHSAFVSCLQRAVAQKSCGERDNSAKQVEKNQFCTTCEGRQQTGVHLFSCYLLLTFFCLFVFLFPKLIWNFFPPPQHKPDVLFRLVCPLYQRTNVPIWSLWAFLGWTVWNTSRIERVRNLSQSGR